MKQVSALILAGVLACATSVNIHSQIDYPDATTTGVPPGTVLSIINSDMTISTANTIIDGKDIRGCVSVTAPGVIIRNSKITCVTGYYAVDSYQVPAPWLTIQDSTITCANRIGTTAIGEEQITVLRSNISGCENGFDVNKNMLIQDNYIHDLSQGGAAHTDGIQMWSIAVNVIIEHNRIYANDGTSAIISPSQGTLGTIIRNNLMAGGAATLYCRQSGPGGQQIINNHFSTIFYPNVGAYYAWTDCEDEAVVSGNVIHETGVLLPGQTSPPPPGTLTLTCPANQTASSSTGQPVAVSFPLGTTTGGTTPISVSSSPASGSLFAVGVSTVVQSAQSADGQKASCGFTVTVTSTAPPPPPPPTNQCVTSPLVVNVTSFPTAGTGGHRLGYNQNGPAPMQAIVVDFPNHRVTFTDTRGCSVTK